MSGEKQLRTRIIKADGTCLAVEPLGEAFSHGFVRWMDTILHDTGNVYHHDSQDLDF